MTRQENIITDGVRAYLITIGRVPLLTAQDEVRLATIIQAGGPEAERAKAQFVEANLRLVVSIARRYIGQGMDLLDIIQNGNIGAMTAVRKFDHTRGFKFSTYATAWIRQSIQRGFENASRTIRVPAKPRADLKQLSDTIAELAQCQGMEPSDEEIAEAMGVTVKKVRAMSGYAKVVASLDAPVNGDDELAPLGDLIPDRAQSTEDTALAGHFADLIEVLEEVERQVIVLRYFEQLTQNEIGSRLALSPARVRQIERKALDSLRNAAGVVLSN